MPALERILYADGPLEVGAFRCAPSRPDFAEAGQIRDHCVFVFPRTAVRIRQRGRPEFTADAGVVAFYNPRQPYTRAVLDPAGDRCEWFALDAATAAEAVREHGRQALRDEGAPFEFSHGPSDAATYLAQRELFHELAHAVEAPAAGALAVHERLLLLLDRVLALACAHKYGGPRDARRPTRREREAVACARDVLALRFREPVSLAEVARLAGLSRFRLCRAFGLATGATMHAFREQLRLRAALEALGDGCADLTALALDLGYSSHSHFTASFRRAFGVTPSQARALLGRRARP